MHGAHTDTDNVRYSIAIRYQSGTSHTLARFTDVRTTPILDNPREYYFTIEKFIIPMDRIPLTIVDIQDGQGNANLTDYSVTVKFGVNVYKTDVIYTPNNSITAPATANPTQVDSPYYYVYAYKNIMRMFNVAFAASHAAKVAAHGGNAQAPYVFYDEQTQLINLVVHDDYITVANLSLWINDKAYKFFNAMEFLESTQGNPNGLDYQFILKDNKNNSAAIVTPLIPANSYIFPEEYKTISYFNSFNDIVFTTDLIPIYAEGEQDNDPTQTGLTKSLNVMTDFSPYIKDAGDSRSYLVYFPQGPYRLIDMTGDYPLRKVDFQIWWSDKKGTLRPLYLSYDQEALVKILFIKKTKTVEVVE